VPGGNLLYAAAGLGVWDSKVGLLARVGEDYPHEWLLSFSKYGWDMRGIHILAGALDLRYFQARLDPEKFQRTNPVIHFARMNLPFPKQLLGYQPPVEVDARKTPQPASPRPVDIPSDYLNAHVAHLCPLDYMTTSRLLSTFRQANVTFLTMDPYTAFMTGAAFDDVRSLLQGLTAFLPSEEELRALFWGRTNDLWEMAEALGNFGCELIVVKRGAHGQMLYDSASKKRWEIPAYPARLEDLTGAGDSFCGGFSAGYQKTFDPVQAVIHGSVSASLTIEGSGAFHALDALPGLAQARLEALSGLVRQA
jgi:sugar/nucleoside kinase (ribokinase family)